MGHDARALIGIKAEEALDHEGDEFVLIKS